MMGKRGQRQVASNDDLAGLAAKRASIESAPAAPTGASGSGSAAGPPPRLSIEEKLQLEHEVVQTAFLEQFSGYLDGMSTDVRNSKTNDQHRETYGDDHFYRVRGEALAALGEIDAGAAPHGQPAGGTEDKPPAESTAVVAATGTPTTTDGAVLQTMPVVDLADSDDEAETPILSRTGEKVHCGRCKIMLTNKNKSYVTGSLHQYGTCHNCCHQKICKEHSRASNMTPLWSGGKV